MRKLLATMAIMAVVTACAEEAEAPAEPVEEVEAAPAVTMESYVGAWDVAMADGSTHVTTNNADGSFTRTYPDGTSNGGIWTFAAEQSCWATDGGESDCYAISEADAAGMITLTNVTDGSVVTATPVAEEAAPEAAE